MATPSDPPPFPEQDPPPTPAPEQDPPSGVPDEHDPPVEPDDPHDPQPHEITDPPVPGAPPAIIA